MSTVTCRWCGAEFEQSQQSGRPRPFVVNGTAHMPPRRRNSRSKRPASAQNIEQPAVLTWVDIESRAQQFWHQKKMERAAPTEVIAA